ncbi:hypothetical protein D030_4234A, partial [Vibrio parahaemolyticus AQ3810]
MVDAR